MKLVLVVSCLAALVGCASAPAPVKPPPGTPIDFSLPIWPSAQPHSFADDRGHILVVDAWASWCQPCKAELPQLDALAKQWKAQGVRVYAVNIDAGGDTVQPFLSEFHIDLPILLDPGGGVLTQTLALRNMPTTWVFDQDGHLVLSEEGKVSVIAEKVNSMLAQPSKP
jgi:cytochrome c biogenesis protein CcmG/thiol:disulfide interchange protein DsbE